MCNVSMRWVKKAYIKLLFAVGLMSGVSIGLAEAQTPEIIWHFRPDAWQVGECFGNCGTGCGPWLFGSNPCGGPREWDFVLTSEPVKIDEEWHEECRGIVLMLVRYDNYRANAIGTFHGRSSDGCREHDADCRRSGGGADCVDLGENLWHLCSGGQDEDWSYDTTVTGQTAHGQQTIITSRRCAIPPPDGE